jgi:hypothetical protein
MANSVPNVRVTSVGEELGVGAGELAMSGAVGS